MPPFFHLLGYFCKVIVQVDHLQNFKHKALQWAQSFNAVCYLDSNGFDDPYSKFDTLIAIGVKSNVMGESPNWPFAEIRSDYAARFAQFLRLSTISTSWGASAELV